MFDTRPLSLARVHTSKRGTRERAGVHAWHPYYAGYAEEFVEDTLAVLAKPGDLILDPWNGSGTTTLIAQRCGLRSIGVELNPAMTLHALAKNLQFPAMAEEIIAEAEDLVESARRRASQEPAESEDISDWVHGEPLTALIALRSAISRIADTAAPDFCRAVLAQGARDQLGPSPKKAFYLSALFQVLREVGSFTRGSNPTWLLYDEEAKSTRTETVLELYLATVRSMLEDLKGAAGSTEKVAAFHVTTGDSRALPLIDEAIDVIVTSPPYCTRIDYAVSTKPELLLLGRDNGEFEALRRETMGAPVIVDKTIAPQDTWGPACNAFLEAVAEHPSKSSQSYYWPNYLQYFRDAEQSLHEIARVLRPGGQAAVVVQSSYYKDIELRLGDMYVEMSQQIGLEAEIARREPVRQHMAHVNTKSSKYVKDKVYYEDVVSLQKEAE